MRQQHQFKMGQQWRKRFISPKRINAGWTWQQHGPIEIIIDPDGNQFGHFNQKTGILTTTQNIMSIQW